MRLRGSFLGIRLLFRRTAQKIVHADAIKIRQLQQNFGWHSCFSELITGVGCLMDAQIVS